MTGIALGAALIPSLPLAEPKKRRGKSRSSAPAASARPTVPQFHRVNPPRSSSFPESRIDVPLKASRQIMKDSQYELIPLHKRPDLLQQCCNLLNSEWKRSETARLRSLTVSCDEYPTCLLLLGKDKVLGHCKVSLIHNNNDSVIIESFVIDHAHRCQGLGSLLLRAVEDYVNKSGIKTIYLTTKGQEGFYSKNGYSVCNSSQMNGHIGFDDSCSNIKNPSPKVELTEKKNIIPNGPPPPPMPIHFKKSVANFCLSIPARTSMKKDLKL